MRRGALLDRLESARERSALTWVVGLPGAGKTSLLSVWAAEHKAKSDVVWYRLDERDADGVAWLDAVASAVGSSALPVWSPDHQAESASFAERYFAALGQASPKCTLVIDDCHRIGDDAMLFELAAALHRVPTSVRIVFLSRREPPPVLSRGVVGGWLSVIDDLRLSPEEAREIARRHRPAREPGARELETTELEQADGWLAHVLAIAHARGGAKVSAQAARVGEFLAAELLESVPRAQRPGLRRLAELPEIPARTEHAPGGSPEIDGLLLTLSTTRYFVELSAQGRYRLHDLLREALLRINTTEDGPATLRDVRCALAAWVGEEMPEAAMQLRVAAGDTMGVLSLLEKHGEAWLARGLHRSIDGWLRDLPPPSATEPATGLALYRAQALLPLEPELARPWFRSARTSAVAAGDARRAYQAWSGEVASYVIQWGAVHGLAELVDDLEAIEAKLGPPDDTTELRVAADALTALMYGRAEDPRIKRFAEWTARAVTHARDENARLAAAAQLLIYRLWWAGDFPGGRALFETYDDQAWTGDHLAPLPRLLWWSNASILDWQAGKAEDCYRKVDRGLELAASSGVHVRDFFLLTQGIFCALSEEHWERAERHLAQLARTERSHKRLDVMVHHFFRSWYALCRGDAKTALAHAETAWPIAEAIGSMFHKVIVLSALGPARVHVGDLAGAEEAYRAQLALAKAAQNPTFSFIAFCAGAELALARGDRAALTKQVERMLMVKALGGFHTGCGWRTPMMRQVLAFALENDLNPEVAKTWIREKRISPPIPPPAAWPMAVRIAARDGLTVTVEGEEGAPGGKSARKLRELLAVLVAERAGASQTELGDWLWPDADGDRAQGSLKTAIHRLRQWLASDAVRVIDGVVSLNPAVVAVDVWNGDPFDPDRMLRGFDLPPIEAARSRLRRR